MGLPLPGGIQLRCFYVCLVAFVVGLIWSLVTGFVIWKPIVLVVWCVLPVVWIVSALSVSLSLVHHRPNCTAIHLKFQSNFNE
jgi:hypothetical protein